MKKKIAIAINSEILDEIDYLAKKKHASRSQEIENLIIQGFKNDRVKTAALLIHENEKNTLFENSAELLEKHALFLETNLIKKIIFISNFSPDEERVIKEKFSPAEIIFIKDDQNGTAEALKKIKKYIYSDFILINADTYNNFNLKRMIEFHKEHPNIITMGLINSDSPEKYGSVLIDGTKIAGFSEKGNPLSNIINAGIYLISPEIFRILKRDKSLEKETIPKLAEQEKIEGYFTLGDYRHYGKI